MKLKIMKRKTKKCRNGFYSSNVRVSKSSDGHCQFSVSYDGVTFMYWILIWTLGYISNVVWTVFIAISTLYLGFGRNALSSSDICSGSGFAFIKAITYYETILLGTCLFFVICEGLCIIYKSLYLLILSLWLQLVILSLNSSRIFVISIWGTINLVNRECYDTIYYKTTLGFMVGSFLLEFASVIIEQKYKKKCV